MPSAVPFLEGLTVSLAVLELGYRLRAHLKDWLAEVIPLAAYLLLLLLGGPLGATQIGIVKACALTYAGYRCVAALWPSAPLGLAVDVAAALALIVGGLEIGFVRTPWGSMVYLSSLRAVVVTLVWVVGVSRLLRVAAALPGLLEGVLALQAYLCMASLYLQHQAAGPSYALTLGFAGITTGLWFHTYRQPPRELSRSAAAAWCNAAAAISAAATSKSLFIATAVLPLLAMVAPVALCTGVVLTSYFGTRIVGPRVQGRRYQLDAPRLVTLTLTFCLMGNLIVLLYTLSGDPFLLAGLSLVAAALIVRLAGHLVVARGPSMARDATGRNGGTATVLGLPFWQGRAGLSREIEGFLAGSRARTIITPDSLSVYRSIHDQEFREILLAADVLVPDGAGVVWAADFLLGASVLEQIPGVELADEILTLAARRGQSVYFLGAQPGIAVKAAAQARERYPGLTVAGARHGFFEPEDEPDVVEDIRRARPDVLMVALGVPRQEIWMHAYRSSLPVRLMIGVGGTFDVLAGEKQRAPDRFQRWGLEWLYRLLIEPSRIRRMAYLPLFVLEVLRVKIHGRFDAPRQND